MLRYISIEIYVNPTDINNLSDDHFQEPNPNSNLIISANINYQKISIYICKLYRTSFINTLHLTTFSIEIGI